MSVTQIRITRPPRPTRRRPYQHDQKLCRHCGIRNGTVEPTRVVAVKGGQPFTTTWCDRCRTEPSRWVQYRPVWRSRIGR